MQPKNAPAPLGRRTLLKLATGAALAATTGASGRAAELQSVKAIAFDAFPIFDPRPIFARAEEIFPGRGAELANAWRARQFEYQWLRALGGRYADFWRATEDALVYAAKLLRLDLDAEKRARLMEGFLELRPWPDVPAALAALRAAGLRLAFLSNFTERMLRRGIETAGLSGLFEQVLSTDRIRSYKPDPRAYRMGVDALGLRRDEILFVAFAGWDAAGAKWFGYPTFWANRAALPGEELGVAADAAGPGLGHLVEYVRRR